MAPEEHQYTKTSLFGRLKKTCRRTLFWPHGPFWPYLLHLGRPQTAVLDWPCQASVRLQSPTILLVRPWDLKIRFALATSSCNVFQPLNLGLPRTPRWSERGGHRVQHLLNVSDACEATLPNLICESFRAEGFDTFQRFGFELSCHFCQSRRSEQVRLYATTCATIPLGCRQR